MNAAEAIGNILSHHGVKGMKWGVTRKATVGPHEVVVRDTRKKIKTSGGSGHPASPEAIRARTIGQVAKKSGTKALTDTELHTYAKRIQLEQNVKRLQYSEKPAATRFVLRILGRTGEQSTQQTANAATAAAGKKALALAMA